MCSRNYFLWDLSPSGYLFFSVCRFPTRFHGGCYSSCNFVSVLLLSCFLSVHFFQVSFLVCVIFKLVSLVCVTFRLFSRSVFPCSYPFLTCVTLILVSQWWFSYFALHLVLWPLSLTGFFHGVFHLQVSTFLALYACSIVFITCIARMFLIVRCVCRC